MVKAAVWATVNIFNIYVKELTNDECQEEAYYDTLGTCSLFLLPVRYMQGCVIEAQGRLGV